MCFWGFLNFVNTDNIPFPSDNVLRSVLKYKKVKCVRAKFVCLTCLCVDVSACDSAGVCVCVYANGIASERLQLKIHIASSGAR